MVWESVEEKQTFRKKTEHLYWDLRASVFCCGEYTYRSVGWRTIYTSVELVEKHLCVRCDELRWVIDTDTSHTLADLFTPLIESKETDSRRAFKCLKLE